MNVAGSLFSGVGGLDCGLARAGFRHRFLAESDPWRRSILAARFPGVPIFDDVHQVAEGARPGGLRTIGGGGSDEHALGARWDRSLDARLESLASDGLAHRGGDRADAPGGELGDTRRNGWTVDLLAGGFPCTDVSVAGKRLGLAGARSGLFYEFARVAGELIRPGGYVLIENVPGLFSSHGGRDFASVLGTMADLGFHDLAWRVLDSQFFGVPQRRRRVFILARRARGQRCAEVLLEPESGGGDLAASREAREEIAGTLGGGTPGGGPKPDTDRMTFVAGTLGNTGGGGPRGDVDRMTFVPDVRTYWDGSDISDTLDSSMLSKGQMMPEKRRFPCVSVPALTSKMAKGTGGPAGDECQNLVPPRPGSGVRRLTPVECERLQGLPDGWTLPGSDSKRYAALGDAVTANVAEWIGRRILTVAAMREED